MPAHTIRIREKRWEEIEKLAWKLSTKAQKVIKPTDLTDTVIALYSEKVTLEDIEKAKGSR